MKKTADHYLYTEQDFSNIMDYKVGDIIEAEVGVFLRVIEKEDNTILTSQVCIIPEPSQYRCKDDWERDMDNALLDLILDAKTEDEKEMYIHLMKHIKEIYPYDKFKKTLEKVRQ